MLARSYIGFGARLRLRLLDARSPIAHRPAIEPNNNALPLLRISVVVVIVLPCYASLDTIIYSYLACIDPIANSTAIVAAVVSAAARVAACMHAAEESGCPLDRRPLAMPPLHRASTPSLSQSRTACLANFHNRLITAITDEQTVCLFFEVFLQDRRSGLLPQPDLRAEREPSYS